MEHGHLSQGGDGGRQLLVMATAGCAGLGDEELAAVTSMFDDVVEV